jgi:hypothetical protein
MVSVKNEHGLSFTLSGLQGCPPPAPPPERKRPVYASVKTSL